MRDSSAVTMVNTSLVEEMQSRLFKRPQMFPFTYHWSHASTGNSGTGTINMPSRTSLLEWVNRWNHSNFANGWVYSIPEK